MEKNLKMKSIITIMIIGIMIMASTITLAAEQTYSAKMSLTSDSKLKEGDTVTVNVNLTSINAGDGLDTISAEVNYDTNVFEEITTADVTSTSGWTPTYVSSTKMITFINSTGNKVKDPGTVATIKLKVKSSINTDSTTVTLKNVKTSGGLATTGGTGDISVGNVSVTISDGKQKPTPSPTTSKTNSAVKDTTTIKSTLPKTGLEQYGIVAIVVVAIIAIFSYALYKKIAKDVK